MKKFVMSLFMAVSLLAGGTALAQVKPAPAPAKAASAPAPAKAASAPAKAAPQKAAQK